MSRASHLLSELSNQVGVVLDAGAGGDPAQAAALRAARRPQDPLRAGLGQQLHRWPAGRVGRALRRRADAASAITQSFGGQRLPEIRDRLLHQPLKTAPRPVAWAASCLPRAVTRPGLPPRCWLQRAASLIGQPSLCTDRVRRGFDLFAGQPAGAHPGRCSAWWRLKGRCSAATAMSPGARFLRHHSPTAKQLGRLACSLSWAWNIRHLPWCAPRYAVGVEQRATAAKAPASRAGDEEFVTCDVACSSDDIDIYELDLDEAFISRSTTHRDAAWRSKRSRIATAPLASPSCWPPPRAWQRGAPETAARVETGGDAQLGLRPRRLSIGLQAHQVASATTCAAAPPPRPARHARDRRQPERRSPPAAPSRSLATACACSPAGDLFRRQAIRPNRSASPSIPPSTMAVMRE